MYAEAHETTIRYLAATPLEQVRQDLTKEARLRQAVRRHEAQGAVSLAPGSQDAAEAATLDDRRSEAAAAVWRHLDDPQRQRLLNLVEATGGDPVDLQEEMDLYV